MPDVNDEKVAILKVKVADLPETRLFLVSLHNLSAAFLAEGKDEDALRLDAILERYHPGMTEGRGT